MDDDSDGGPPTGVCAVNNSKPTIIPNTMARLGKYPSSPQQQKKKKEARTNASESLLRSLLPLCHVTGDRCLRVASFLVAGEFLANLEHEKADEEHEKEDGAHDQCHEQRAGPSIAFVRGGDGKAPPIRGRYEGGCRHAPENLPRRYRLHGVGSAACRGRRSTALGLAVDSFKRGA